MEGSHNSSLWDHDNADLAVVERFLRTEHLRMFSTVLAQKEGVGEALLGPLDTSRPGRESSCGTANIGRLADSEGCLLQNPLFFGVITLNDRSYARPNVYSFDYICTLLNQHFVSNVGTYVHLNPLHPFQLSDQTGLVTGYLLRSYEYCPWRRRWRWWPFYRWMGYKAVVASKSTDMPDGYDQGGENCLVPRDRPVWIFQHTTSNRIIGRNWKINTRKYRRSSHKEVFKISRLSEHETRVEYLAYAHPITPEPQPNISQEYMNFVTTILEGRGMLLDLDPEPTIDLIGL